MNRVIKFRVWDSSSKHMFINCPNILIDSQSGYPLWQFGLNGPCLMVDIVLMQSTGLLDKNGKEIYEGDVFVVRTLHDGDEYIWNQEAFNSGKEGAIPQAVSWNQCHVRFEFGNSTRIIYAPYDFEVIGNIYENPELVK